MAARGTGKRLRNLRGRIAHRRITDSANESDPQLALENIRKTYKAGDTDLAWTRLTNWRIQLAAVLDQADSSPVTAVTVEGASDSPSTILLAAWLTLALDAPVTIVADPAGTGIRRVRLTRPGGDVQLYRPGPSIAELTQPGQPAQRISLPRRSLKDCLAEELRRLDPDEVFGETITSLNTSTMQQETPMTFTCSGEPGRNQDRQSLIAV